MKDAATEEAHYEQYFVDEPPQNAGTADGETAHQPQSSAVLEAGITAEVLQEGRAVGEHEF